MNFGSTTQLPVTGQAVFVTQLLDADGLPVLDVNGRQIYVENLGAKGGQMITFSVAGGKVAITPYLDAGGYPVSVASLAGTDDGHGEPLFVVGRNIDINGSGVIASNAKLLATGNINGLIFARNNLDINSQSSVNVTALARGSVSVSGQSVSGSITGVGGVSASGDSITANLVSANVTGATSGQSGLGQGGAANGASQGLANSQSSQVAATTDQSNDEDEKKKGKKIALAQKVSRVTVILPQKKVSETKTPTPGT